MKKMIDMMAAALRRRRRRRPDAARSQLGMTLIEIMVVVAILGLLAGAFTVAYFKYFRESKKKIAVQAIESVEQAVQLYMLENNGECPTDLADLRKEKYLKRSPKDPWGEDFVFKCPGEQNTEGADIFSKGPDKQEGTDDDIYAGGEDEEEAE
jgi:general secretion pathway protein G